MPNICNPTVNPTVVRADVGIGPYGTASKYVHNGSMLIKADSLNCNLAGSARGQWRTGLVRYPGLLGKARYRFSALG